MLEVAPTNAAIGPTPVPVPDRRRAAHRRCPRAAPGLLRPHRPRGAASSSTGAPWRSVSAGLIVQMFLLESLGWIIATTVLFMAATLAFGSRRLLIDASRSGRADRPRLRGVQLWSRPDPADRHRRSSSCCPITTTKKPSQEAADHGNARLARPRLRRGTHPLQPALVGARRDHRHRHRRAAGHRPGADRGAAAAGHLQPRADLGLHHVRRHLLRRHVRRLDHLDPAQHAGRVGLDRDRDRRPRDGAQGPRRPGAGDGRHRLLRRRHDRHHGADLRRPADGQDGAAVRPGRVFRAHGAGPDHGHGRARRQPVARPVQPVHRPGAGPGRHRPADRPGALHASASRSCWTASTRWWSRSACSRSARPSTSPSRYSFETEEIYALKGSMWMSKEDWRRSWKPWLRGTLPGLPDRRAAGGRQRDPDLPLLPDREAPVQASARSSATAPSRPSPVRKPPTMPPRPVRWRRCCRSACRPRPRPRSCWPRSSNTACSPARCCSTATRSWSGA